MEESKDRAALERNSARASRLETPRITIAVALALLPHVTRRF
jgi:hypothetical protein